MSQSQFIKYTDDKNTLPISPTFKKKKLSHLIGSQSKEFVIGSSNDNDGTPQVQLNSEEITYNEIKKVHLGGSFGEHVFEKIKGGSLTQGMRVVCT